MGSRDTNSCQNLAPENAVWASMTTTSASPPTAEDSTRLRKCLAAQITLLNLR